MKTVLIFTANDSITTLRAILCNKVVISGANTLCVDVQDYLQLKVHNKTGNVIEERSSEKLYKGLSFPSKERHSIQEGELVMAGLINVQLFKGNNAAKQFILDRLK